jgi:hypothetical protein
MVRQLFWAFAASLDARRGALNEELDGIVSKYTGSATSNSTVDARLPLQAKLAQISGQSFGSSMVGLAGTEIRENEWLGGGIAAAADSSKDYSALYANMESALVSYTESK